MDIKDLFEYNWYCRRKFLECMGKLAWEEIVEDRGASFGSMRDIFLHSLEAEQGWLRHLAKGKIGEWPSHDYDRDFKDIDAIRKYMEGVEAGGRAYFARIEHVDLERPPGWIRTERYSVEDVLMHVVEEEIHHRGELICLMWQIDIEPPYTSYMEFSVKGNRRRSQRRGKRKRTT